MLLGTRLWYGFFGTTVTNDDKFHAKIEEMCREIGKPAVTPKTVVRSVMALSPKPKATTAVPDASTARVAAPTSASAENSPVPVPAPAPGPGPGPGPALSASLQRLERLERLGTAGSVGGTFAELSAFMKEQQAISDARVDKMKTEMETKLAAMEAKLNPAPLLDDEQLSALQLRLDDMHAAGLLQESELRSCEDVIADVIGLEACIGKPVTAELAQANYAVKKLCKMVAMSAKIPSNAALARQIRRFPTT